MKPCIFIICLLLPDIQFNESQSGPRILVICTKRGKKLKKEKSFVYTDSDFAEIMLKDHLLTNEITFSEASSSQIVMYKVTIHGTTGTSSH